MKLTDSDRQAFIRAVLDDVPTIDYNKQCRSLLMKWAVARMPDAVRAAYETHPEFFQKSYMHIPSCLNSVYIPMPDSIQDIERVDPEIFAQLMELSDKARLQANTQTDLAERIRSAIFACPTLKKAKALMPEFEKYMPADRDGSVDRSMPMISNLVATLVEAGWPKSQGAAA